jgi:hypothetical protein
MKKGNTRNEETISPGSIIRVKNRKNHRAVGTEDVLTRITRKPGKQPDTFVFIGFKSNFSLESPSSAALEPSLENSSRGLGGENSELNPTPVAPKIRGVP